MINFIILTLLLISPMTWAKSGPKYENFRLIENEYKIVDCEDIVEGSLEFHGIQPDYYIDCNSRVMIDAISYVRSLSFQGLEFWELIRLVSAYVSQQLLVAKEYNNPEYLGLLERYRKQNIPVPLSAYINIAAGVCREHALLVHLLLRTAHVPNVYMYVKVIKDNVREDHAFVVILKDKEIFLVDAYFESFNLYPLKVFGEGDWVLTMFSDVEKAPALPGRKIVRINRYPKIWKKSSVDEYFDKELQLMEGIDELTAKIPRSDRTENLPALSDGGQMVIRPFPRIGGPYSQIGQIIGIN